MSEVDLQFAAASHDGYPEVYVLREITSRSDGFAIVDTWTPRNRGHFAPWSRFLWNAALVDVEECVISANALSMRFRLAQSGVRVAVRVEVSGVIRSRLGLQESSYSEQFGKMLPALETIMTGDSTRNPARVCTVVSILS
jgi:hypothetical protein